MSKKKINREIAKAGFPEITLYRGEGYHYFIYDAEDVHESESVMCVYLNSLPIERWVEDGIAFGKKVRQQIADRPTFVKGSVLRLA